MLKYACARVMAENGASALLPHPTWQQEDSSASPAYFRHRGQINIPHGLPVKPYAACAPRRTWASMRRIGVSALPQESSKAKTNDLTNAENISARRPRLGLLQIKVLSAALVAVLLHATFSSYLVTRRMKAKLIADVHESVLNSLRMTEQKVLNEIARRLQVTSNLAIQVEQIGEDTRSIQYLLNNTLTWFYNTPSAPVAAYVAFPDGRLICSGPIGVEGDLRQRPWWRQYLQGKSPDEELGHVFTTRGLLLNSGFIGDIRLYSGLAVMPLYWAVADNQGLLKFVLGMDFYADLTETPTESLFAFERGSYSELFDRSGILLAFPSTGLASVKKFKLFTNCAKTNLLVATAIANPDSTDGYLIYRTAERGEVLGMYMRGSFGYIYTREKPLAEIYGAINRELAFVIWLSLVLAMIVALFLSGFLLRDVVRPVRQLVEAMDRLGSGELKTRVNGERHDEFGYLFRQFNATAERLESLIHEACVARLARRQAELEFLQAQINPHFLYNTLDCIYRLVLSGDSEEGSKAILSLSRLFRLSLGRGHRVVRIAEAIEQLGHYFDLQRLRHGDRITVKIDVPPELANYEIPKLLLQPLVENAFVHGLEPKRGRGTLAVIGRYENGTIHFTVIDDGIGLTDEQMAEVQRALSESAVLGSHGLVNVHRRLVLAYGEEWGLSLSHNPGGGLRVDIRWPARRMCPDGGLG